MQGRIKYGHVEPRPELRFDKKAIYVLQKHQFEATLPYKGRLVSYDHMFPMLCLNTRYLNTGAIPRNTNHATSLQSSNKWFPAMN